MKALLRNTAIATVVAGTSLIGSQAAAEVEANIGVTTNYIWRGVTQTNDQAAVSGGLDYSNASGFYAGTWASNVDFGGDGANDTGTEVDLYGGFGGEISGFGYDIGLIYYAYPQQADSDFLELGLSGSFSAITVGVNLIIDSDIDEGVGATFAEDDLYYYASAGFDLSNDYSLGLTIGAYDFDNDVAPGADDTDYTHFQVALTKAAGDFGDFTFAVDVNDLDGEDGNTAADDPRVTASWSKTF